jgi:DNA-directed RNA polymerase specialized sigma subunit
MNNFTNFINFTKINESVKRINTSVLTVDDINNYLDSVKKRIPEQVSNTIYLTAKYNLVTQKDIDDIKNANKGQLNKLAFKYNISIKEMEDLWECIKSLKTNIRLLPQYQTSSEFSAFISGKIDMTDITIDLDTSAGRNACAKQYMGMVHKIVNTYVGRSKLGKPELMSAALQGFTDAMNDWRKNGDESAVPFKTYAAYRVKQQILNDINEYSYSMKTNWYAVKKMGSSLLNAVSIDGMAKTEDGEFKQDHLKALGTTHNYDLTASERHSWNELYELLGANLKQRDLDIFYRFFGLNGYQREKSKDIAKSLGISQSLITSIIKDIITKKLKNNPKAMEILHDLLDSYNESLMFDIMNFDKSMIIETILADDMFMMLEELTKWSNKDIYINTLNNVIDSIDQKESKIIIDILSKDFDYLDKNFKANKKVIIKFLGLMNPTETFARKSDVALLEYMDELSTLYKKYSK